MVVPTVHAWPDELDTLKRTVEVQAKELDLLREQVRLLLARLYGRKSERFDLANADAQQLLLFAAGPLPFQEKAEAPVAEIQVPSHTRRMGGRQPLPEHLPRIETVHDISEVDKTCGCGAMTARKLPRSSTLFRLSFECYEISAPSMSA